MQTRFGLWSRPMTLALSLCVMVACGDDDDDEPTVEAGSGGNAAKGGTGGKAGGSAGTGGKAGATNGGSGGLRAGSGGAGGTTTPGGMFMCEGTPSTEPVKCGGETCTPQAFGMNSCIVSCCINVNGKETCGSKSTAMGLVTECSGPILPDPSCPDVEDGQGGTLEGCCNASKKKCGIISTLRPSCVTESMLITLPSPLKECGGDTGSDAGAPDAG